MSDNPQFPKSLQENPNMDYSESIIDSVVRSNPDVGASMSRPRFTRTRIAPKLSIWVDKSQYEDFMEFYDVDLRMGCLAFDWINPIKEIPATLKFSKPPVVSYIGTNTWQISCEFEEM